VPFDYTKTAPVVNNSSVIRFLRCTTAIAHNLPLDSTAPIDNVSRVYLITNDSNYSTTGGLTQYATATDANTFYMGTGKTATVQGITGTNNRISFLKVVLDSALNTQKLQAVFNAILANTENPKFNNVNISFISNSSTILTGAVAWGSNYGSASDGLLLDTQGQELTLALNRFFTEKNSPVAANWLPVNVFEIGDDTVSNGVDYLFDFLTVNSNHLKYKRWLFPVAWGKDTSGYAKKLFEHFNQNDFDMQFILPVTLATVGLYKNYSCFVPLVNDPSTTSYELNENSSGALLFKLVNRFLDDTRYNMPIDGSFINAAYGDLTPFDIRNHDDAIASIRDAKVTVVSYNEDRTGYKFVGGLNSDSFTPRLVNGRVANVDCEVTTRMGVHEAKRLIVNAFNKRIEQSKNDSAMLLLINSPMQVMATVQTLLALINTTLKDCADNKNLVAYVPATALSYPEFVKNYGQPNSNNLGGFFKITLQKNDFLLTVDLTAVVTYG
jgi:hypothetical protein